MPRRVIRDYELVVLNLLDKLLKVGVPNCSASRHGALIARLL